MEDAAPDLPAQSLGSSAEQSLLSATADCSYNPVEGPCIFLNFLSFVSPRIFLGLMNVLPPSRKECLKSEEVVYHTGLTQVQNRELVLFTSIR